MRKTSPFSSLSLLGRWLFTTWLLAGLSSCAPAAQERKPQTPTALDQENPPQAQEPVAAPQEQQAPELPAADVLYGLPKQVPPPPTTCPPGAPLPAPATCSDATQKVAQTLRGKDPSERDRALADLERCSQFPPGLLRALRVELGEAQCGDQLVEPLVGDGQSAQPIPAETRETLVALGLGARLRRLAVRPPEPPASRTKDALAEYFAKDLFPWIEGQAAAIFSMASQGKELSGYARGLVAIEAGNADMRFVEIARAVPVSEEIEKYQEAKDLYYAALDEQLEPRKARGRNAALVGLREMARLGVRESQRVDSARALLSRVFGGRRVNALDALLVPPLPQEDAHTDAELIATQVPTPYTTPLIGTTAAEPALIRAHLHRGMPVGLRRAIEDSDDPTAHLLLAHGLFESGRTYFRAEDFQDASVLLAELLDEPEGLDANQKERATLLRALSVALLSGPKDAAEMIAQGPRFADALGNLALLDALAEAPGELGGRAAFDAAYLREMVVQPADPDAWNELAQRYERSAQKLRGEQARVARERARACRAIEKTVRKQLATSR